MRVSHMGEKGVRFVDELWEFTSVLQVRSDVGDVGGTYKFFNM